MTTIYTDVTEFKRLIEEKKISQERMKAYLKGRGMFFTSSNASTLAEQVYTIFLGSKEMSDITEMLQSDSNYEKSLMLKAKPKEHLADDTNPIDIFVDEIARIRSMPSLPYIIEAPVRSQDSEEASVFFTYEKRLPGKNVLLQKEKRTLKLGVRKISENEVAIDIRQQSASDAAEALRFLKLIEGNPDESVLSFIHINLLTLPAKSCVEFFDRIMKTQFKLWKLITITGITLKKSQTEIEDEDDDAEAEDVSEEKLAVIRQAALQGQGLYQNKFVKETLEQGYIISSMRFRYACKLEAEEFCVVISSKGKDITIDIDKTYYEEENKMLVSPFSKQRQDEIILIFQNEANSIYSEIRKELAEKAQNQIND